MLSAHAISRSRWPCLVATACLSVLATSAAFGWGHHDKEYRYSSETRARDLLGRWRYQSIAHEGVEETSRTKAVAYIDIVACGARYCGIGVGAEGTCGAMLLAFQDRGSKFDTFADNGDNEVLERFSGTLDLHDGTGRYVVFLDVGDGDDQRPLYDDETKLTVVGSSDGAYGRTFPIEMTFSYAGKPVCKAPTS